MTDLQWASVRPRKCRHSKDRRQFIVEVGDTVAEGYWKCSCGHIIDRDLMGRGRNNRSRGNAIERWVCKQLGITRVGMFGSAEDGGRHDEPWVVQVKSGGYFTERYWTELKRLPANAQQTALLVVAEAPGSDSGRKRRAYVVMDLDDFRALHVGSGEDAA